MFSWWVWVLIWVVLVVGGGALIGWLGWRTWGKVKALTREVGRAERLVGQLETLLAERTPADDEPFVPAIFTAPAQARAERDRLRATLRKQRRERARARRPGWARGLD